MFATKAKRIDEQARAVVENFPRQALHAAALGFEHPVTGSAMRFEAPMPDDMIALRDALQN